MSYRDAIAIAARSVTRRLGRAVLTVLAVALAAALLSSLLIAGTAARSRVLDDVSRGGPLTGIRVDAAAPDLGALDSDDPPRGEPRPLDNAALHRIAALPGVRDVVAVVANPVLVITPAKLPAPSHRTTTTTGVPGSSDLESGRVTQFRDELVGVDLTHASDVPVTLEAGRLPEATSTTEVAVTDGFLRRLGLTKDDAERVLGVEVELGAPRLFSDPNDNVVRGRWTRMSIVGVVAQEVGDGQLLAPIAIATQAREWVAAGASAGSFAVDDSPYSALFVVARSLALVGSVRADITKVGFSTSAPESLIESVQRYLHVVEIVLGGIGLIGLVIAALGITNAMLAAVRERRREIGVLKAIGARDRDVRRIFLLEAATLGCVGGAIGTTAGWLTARALAGVVNGYLEKEGLAGVSLSVPTTVLIGGVVGATLLALVAGTLPAQRAARLPARQAMGDR
jgi:ABC-type antimicrobial peptide transport system permease subunit